MVSFPKLFNQFFLTHWHNYIFIVPLFCVVSKCFKIFKNKKRKEYIINKKFIHSYLQLKKKTIIYHNE